MSAKNLEEIDFFVMPNMVSSVEFEIRKVKSAIKAAASKIMNRK